MKKEKRRSSVSKDAPVQDPNDRPEFLTEFESGIADHFDNMKIGTYLQQQTAHFIRLATIQRMRRILSGEEPGFQGAPS